MAGLNDSAKLANVSLPGSHDTMALYSLADVAKGMNKTCLHC